MKVEGGNGESWKLLEWLVKVGDEVHEGERLAVLSGKGGSRLEVLAARSGKVVRLSVDRGRELKRGAEVCELEYCSHAVVFGGLCTLCGKDLSMGHFSQVRRKKRVWMARWFRREYAAFAPSLVTS